MGLLLEVISLDDAALQTTQTGFWNGSNTYKDKVRASWWMRAGAAYGLLIDISRR
jgi:hypothetical protein